MPNMGLDETSTRVIQAVRAESARYGVTGKQLADALGRDKKYVYERFRFEKPFSTSDLEVIAHRLGITPQDLWDSAQFGHRKRIAVAA
jgi:lambda repressor-like predicted transcriptional regulator